MLPIHFSDDNLMYKRGQFKHVVDAITCKDGFKLSVQASDTHYCSPHSDYGPWDKVEVGYPSERPEPWDVWQKYCEDPESPTQTVYGYVPAIFVIQLIQSHSGMIDTEDTESTTTIDGDW